MNKPIKVGLTGGIGSGKTLVTQLFAMLGAPIYNADNRAKVLMNSALMEPIQQLFGTESFIDGKLNRAFIAGQVFNDKPKLDALNGIVHPAVAIDFQSWMNDYLNAKYVIKEAAILVESGSAKTLNKLIVVTSPTELRVERIKARDVFRSEEEIENIIKNQTSDEEKEKMADFFIRNNNSQLLIPQVLAIDKKIRQH